MQKQVQQWRRRIAANRRHLTHEFQVLPRLAPDWTNLLDWLERATALEQTEVWFRQQMAEPVVLVVGLRERVDGLLLSLISTYDEEEDALRREEQNWSSVVTHGGDHAKAERDQEISSADESARSDLLTLITNIGTSPEGTDASTATRQFALSLATEWISSAAHLHATACRDEQPSAIRLEIDGWTGQLPLDGRHDHLVAGFREFVQRQVDRELSTLTAMSPAVAIVASLSIFALSLRSLSPGWPTPEIAMVLTSVAIFLVMASGFWTYRSYLGLPARRAKVRARGERRMAAGEADLRAAAQEIQDAIQLWETLLAHENSLDEVLREQSSAAEPPNAAERSLVDEPPLPGPSDDPRRRREPRPADPGFRDDPRLAVRLRDWDLLPPPDPRPRSEADE